MECEGAAVVGADDAVLQNVFGESMTVRVECGGAPAEEEDDMERELIAMFGEANVDIKE